MSEKKERSLETYEGPKEVLSKLVTYSGALIGFVILGIIEVLSAAQVCSSHGYEHALEVMRHAQLAIEASPIPIPPLDALAILFAALLHDVDDRKFFPKNAELQNAKLILTRALMKLPSSASSLLAELPDLVYWMVDKVSTSKNGDSIPPEALKKPWLLIPRYADRLTALGWEGVYRCGEYTKTVKRPFFTEETERATSEADLFSRIAPPERFRKYVEGKGQSKDMISHFYDKLLHICEFKSDNPYLDAEARKRRLPLVQVCLEFGKTGTCDESILEAAKERIKEERGV